MYWKDKATLIQEKTQPTPDGYKIPQETRRAVFCNRKSATRAEFYAAKQAGEKIALVLEVRGVDYQDETRVEFGGKPFEVVRTYTRSGEVCELNCREAAETEESSEPEQYPDSGA